MKDETTKKVLSAEQIERLQKVADMPDEMIDLEDIPEASFEKRRLMRRPGLYKPVKQPVTIRLDGDVVAWFKERAQDSGYQSEINRVLREHMLQALKKSA
jgi:uncharacterized protein (DUF4415 family)